MIFDKMSFSITGSDDAVKQALVVMSDIAFIAQSQYQIRVKIELANEHKEFVSGKKNGKINKIMGQSRLTPSGLSRQGTNGFQATSRLFLMGLTSITST